MLGPGLGVRITRGGGKRSGVTAGLASVLPLVLTPLLT